MPNIKFSEDITLADGRVVPAGTVVKNAPAGITRKQLLKKLNKSGTEFKVFGRNALAGLVDTMTAVPDLMINASAKAVNDVARIPQALGEGAAALRTGNFGQFGTTPELINRPPLGQRHFVPDSNDIFAAAQVMGENMAHSQAGVMNAARALPSKVMNASAMVANTAARFPQAIGEGLGALRTQNFDQFGTTPALINRPPQEQIAPTPQGVSPISLDDARARQQALTDAGRDQFPMSALLGNATGGAASLVGLRAPIAAQRGLSQLQHVRNIEAAKLLAKRSSGAVANSPTLSAAFNEAFKRSTALKTLGNRVGRAGEAGLEGAAIALLNGGDPMEVAAYSAGGQAAGSLLLGGISAATGSGGIGTKGLRLMGAAAGIGALLQVVKTAAPGGENSVIESVKSGFEKVTLGLALGAVSGIAGAGRVSNRFPVKALPELADAITSVPRGAFISVLNEALKDKTVEKTLNKLKSNPSYFGDSATTQLNRAIFSEKISVSETINSLMQGKAFREKMEGL